MKRRTGLRLAVTLTLLLAGAAAPRAWAQEAAAGEGGEAATPPAPPPPDPAKLRALKLSFEREPTVKEVQRHALRFFQVHPDRVQTYRTGAMLKALVPDLEVGANAERGVNDRRMVDALYARVFEFKETEDNSHTTYSLNLRAHWALDRLVFNAEVLDVTSLVGVQEGLLREVTSLYFTRRRLMTFLKLNPPQDPGERITESIRLEEITANLDALTGGYFTDELRKRLGT